MRIRLKRELQGSILDIGGGGDGVMGRLYGERVTAIDRMQEELDQAPGGYAKLVMDARELAFPGESFDHVTFFYSLMYMDREARLQSLLEAARVLRRGGGLHIWDVDIPAALEVCMVPLDIVLPRERFHTCYGIAGEDIGQEGDAIALRCLGLGLTLLCQRRQGAHFHVSFLKPGAADEALPPAGEGMTPAGGVKRILL